MYKLSVWYRNAQLSNEKREWMETDSAAVEDSHWRFGCVAVRAHKIISFGSEVIG